jgi:Putative transposase
VVLGALMSAAGESIDFLCKKDDILGATVGQLAILHTWRRDLGVHPHVHVIVTAGGWNAEQQSWVAAKRYGSAKTPFLMPVDVLLRAFQLRLRRLLIRAYARGEFSDGPHEAFPHLATPAIFAGALTRMCATRGVARIEPPFGGPEQLLKYLGAYVNRVAISPQRVTHYDATTSLVTYTWSTNAAPDITCTATIPATDFLIRFAQHILPPGFHRIRFRGLWCTAHRDTKLHLVQRWFASNQPATAQPPSTPSTAPERPLDDDPCRCTTCGLGRWRYVPGTWQRPTTAERQRLLRHLRQSRRAHAPLEAAIPA